MGARPAPIPERHGSPSLRQLTECKLPSTEIKRAKERGGSDQRAGTAGEPGRRKQKNAREKQNANTARRWSTSAKTSPDAATESGGSEKKKKEN